MNSTVIILMYLSDGSFPSDKEWNTIKHVNKIAPRFQEGINAFSGSPIVAEVRTFLSSCIYLPFYSSDVLFLFTATISDLFYTDTWSGTNTWNWICQQQNTTWLNHTKRQWGYAILLSGYLILPKIWSFELAWLIVDAFNQEAEKEVAADLAEQDQAIHDIQNAQSRHDEEVEARYGGLAFYHAKSYPIFFLSSWRA
jgi:hypothetical protein